jgi:hypothetical protein
MKEVPRRTPSQYDNCIKLDVIASGVGVSVTSVAQPASAQLLAGHPDAIQRTFRAEHAQVFCFQSVYYAYDEGTEAAQAPEWRTSRRFVCVSVRDMHKALFRFDLMLKWKNLYEVVLERRGRNLYFDLEMRRDEFDPEMSIQQQDCECWRMVQQLKQAVRDTFKCGFGIQLGISCVAAWY